MDIVPITIWREARGEGHTGMLAVAWVIHNRTIDPKKRWYRDPERVCLQRKQFSCWNDTNGERENYPADTDPQFADATQIAETFRLGPILPDPTQGATFYLNPSAVAQNPFTLPPFVKTVEIGKHWFYKE